MNPIYKSNDGNLITALKKEIIFQIVFIAYNSYKAMKFYSESFSLAIIYIIFAVTLLLYGIYCGYSLCVKKYPNHLIWILMKTIVYILKIVGILLDIIMLFRNDIDLELFFRKVFITVIVIYILLSQITSDIYKYSKIDYFKHAGEEENKVSILILYFILNPIMIFYGIYNIYLFKNYNLNLCYMNIALAIIFFFNVFMVASKYTICNLLVLVSAIIGTINYVFYVLYGIMDRAIFSSEATITERVLFWICTVLSLMLLLYVWDTRHQGKKLIYKKGEYQYRRSCFITRNGLFYTESSNEEDHAKAYNESIGKKEKQ